VAREYEPAAGQWYENLEENENFRVLRVDEDAETIEIEYLDGDIEEIDLDTWAELDLDKIDEPEGWAGSDEVVDDDDDDDEDEDLDETWDEDEDEEEDDDWDDDADENGHY
jgi:hypothetical protein